jgi:hypothetical protein
MGLSWAQRQRHAQGHAVRLRLLAYRGCADGGLQGGCSKEGWRRADGVWGMMVCVCSAILCRRGAQSARAPPAREALGLQQSPFTPSSPAAPIGIPPWGGGEQTPPLPHGVASTGRGREGEEEGGMLGLCCGEETSGASHPWVAAPAPARPPTGGASLRGI